jgi:hypothetical protein
MGNKRHSKAAPHGHQSDRELGHSYEVAHGPEHPLEQQGGAKLKAPKPKPPSAETQIEKLIMRDWQEIRGEWLKYPPKAPPGTRPEFELAEFTGLNEVASRAKTAEKGIQSVRLVGLHQAFIEDALFSVCRAANVIGCGEIQSNAHPTWSLAVAYQGSLFALDAVLKFLGVCTLQVENTSLVVDIWPAPREKLSKKELANFQLGEEPLFLWSGKFDHYHRWALLKRVLATLRPATSPLPRDITRGLLSIDDKKFARQRNDLHYRVVWPFEDILTHLKLPELSTFPDMSSLKSALEATDNEQNDSGEINRFGMALAFTMFYISLLLLEDLAKGSVAYEQYFNAILSTLNQSQHPFFESFYSRINIEVREKNREAA